MEENNKNSITPIPNYNKIYFLLCIGFIALVFFAIVTKDNGHWEFLYYVFATPVYLIIGGLILSSAFSIRKKGAKSRFVTSSLVIGFIFVTLLPAMLLTQGIQHIIFAQDFIQEKKDSKAQDEWTIAQNSQRVALFENAIQNSETFKITAVYKNYIYFEAPYVNGKGYGTYTGIAYLPNTDPVAVENYLKQNINSHKYTMKLIYDKGVLNNFENGVNTDSTESHISDEGVYLLEKYTKNISLYDGGQYRDWSTYLEAQKDNVIQQGLNNFIYGASAGLNFRTDIPVELYEDGILINNNFKSK